MNENVRRWIRKRRKAGWGIHRLEKHYNLTFNELMEVLEK